VLAAPTTSVARADTLQARRRKATPRMDRIGLPQFSSCSLFRDFSAAGISTEM
jgi:hypothetical protein